MTMKRLKGIFTGTLPLFLLLWAGMMGILGGLTREKLLHEVQSAIASAREKAEYNYQRVWAGESSVLQKSTTLSFLLDGWIPASDKLGIYDGAIQFVFYAADGQELARSQLTHGIATPLGSENNDPHWDIWLDPVLSQEEQLHFAHLLLENPLLTYLDGFLYDQSQTSEDAFCQIVGVADEERHVLYPKTITYIYPDRENCILDSNSSFFHNKELTTMQFQSISLSSGLTEMGPSPEQALRYWQEAGERAEAMYQGYPDSYETAVTSDGSACISLEDGTVLVCGCSYELTFLIIDELKSTALFTLLATVAMALFTDHRQRQAIQRERDFARAAAHELKTPLAVLRAHAEALREDIAPEKREQYLDVVLSESDRMAALVGHLLELSRPESKQKKEPVDLAALVREVWTPLALPLEQKNLQLQLELEEVSLSGDRTQLAEAAENLASNALRYAQPGGVIRVTLEKLGHWVRLTVYNDGPNIPAEDLSRLWEPFYRADPSRSRDSGGTGLGLAIVRKAVEAHGGQCWAENRSGGVAFVLEFPLA